MLPPMYKKFVWAGGLLVLVLLVGTFGYWFIGAGDYPVIDCLYMTVITISTIGYGEVIDVSGHPAGRVFTMFVAICGIGILTYVLTNLTAFVVEGNVKETFRRNKMEKQARRMEGHYIVCGISGVGMHIISELRSTARECIIIENEASKAQAYIADHADAVVLEGDATDNAMLRKAGIDRARGLFAVTGDDNQNLVIALSTKQLNPNVKVVAGCQDLNHVEKVKRAGADSVISPTYIGGLRMASEMLRPTVVSFLDIMMRDTARNLRVEEVALNAAFARKKVADLHLRRFPNTLLLAIKSPEDWVYNPPADYELDAHATLIVMTTPEERRKLEESFRASPA